MNVCWLTLFFFISINLLKTTGALHFQLQIPSDLSDIYKFKAKIAQSYLIQLFILTSFL